MVIELSGVQFGLKSYAWFQTEMMAHDLKGANVRFFALMNVSSRCWSLFHTNECVFSRNEQQKV